MKQKLIAEWQTGNDFIYRVREGETVRALAARFVTTPGLLIADNRLTEEVREGDLLLIKHYEGTIVTVMPDCSPESIKQKYGADYADVLQKNKTPYLYVGMRIFI